jgi:putative NADH-flavin reductase
MRLLVFGSTGGTGREIVRQALEQGHNVTAFARNPARLGLTHERLKTAPGDVFDYASIERAVRGHDAVLSALGTRKLGKTSVLSSGTRHIVRAMEAALVRRFVCESSLGVGDSSGQMGALYTYLVIPLFLRNIYADKEVQERIVRESSLDWIVVRPAVLTNGPRTGLYRAGFDSSDRSIAGKISRADVADFMLKQVSDDTYLRQTPGLSY